MMVGSLSMVPRFCQKLFPLCHCEMQKFVVRNQFFPLHRHKQRLLSSKSRRGSNQRARRRRGGDPASQRKIGPLQDKELPAKEVVKQYEAKIKQAGEEPDEQWISALWEERLKYLTIAVLSISSLLACTRKIFQYDKEQAEKDRMDSDRRLEETLDRLGISGL
ncbi:hypothetical protein ACA910_015668 [Epithemia clementina (nom. ined.)]